jgi:hypothetical protein
MCCRWLCLSYSLTVGRWTAKAYALFVNGRRLEDGELIGLYKHRSLSPYRTPWVYSLSIHPYVRR